MCHQIGCNCTSVFRRMQNRYFHYYEPRQRAPRVLILHPSMVMDAPGLQDVAGYRKKTHVSSPCLVVAGWCWESASWTITWIRFTFSYALLLLFQSFHDQRSIIFSSPLLGFDCIICRKVFRDKRINENKFHIHLVFKEKNSHSSC